MSDAMALFIALIAAVVFWDAYVLGRVWIWQRRHEKAFVALLDMLAEVGVLPPIEEMTADRIREIADRKKEKRDADSDTKHTGADRL